MKEFKCVGVLFFDPKIPTHNYTWPQKSVKFDLKNT